MRRFFFYSVSNICSIMANFPAKRLGKNTVLKNTHAPFFFFNFVTTCLLLIISHIPLVIFMYFIKKVNKLKKMSCVKYLMSLDTLIEPQKFHLQILFIMNELIT